MITGDNPDITDNISFIRKFQMTIYVVIAINTSDNTDYDAI